MSTFHVRSLKPKQKYARGEGEKKVNKTAFNDTTHKMLFTSMKFGSKTFTPMPTSLVVCVTQPKIVHILLFRGKHTSSISGYTSN